MKRINLLGSWKKFNRRIERAGYDRPGFREPAGVWLGCTAGIVIVLLIGIIIFGCGGGSGNPGFSIPEAASAEAQETEPRELTNKEYVIWEFVISEMLKTGMIAETTISDIPEPLIKENPNSSFMCGGVETCSCRRSDFIELCTSIVDNLHFENRNEFVYANEIGHEVARWADRNHKTRYFTQPELIIFKAEELF